MNDDAINFDLKDKINGKDFFFWFLLTVVGFIMTQLLIQPFELQYQLPNRVIQIIFLFALAGGILGFLQWLKLRLGINGAGIWIFINVLACFSSCLFIAAFFWISYDIFTAVNTFPSEFVQLATIFLITMPVALSHFIFFRQKRIILPSAWLIHGLISAVLFALVNTVIDIFFNQIISPWSSVLFSLHHVIKLTAGGVVYAIPTSFAISMVQLPGKKGVNHHREEPVLDEKPLFRRLPKWVGIFAACTGVWIFLLLPTAMTISSRDSWILIIATVIAGLIRGTFQWLGFRRWFPRSKLWIPITAGCEMLGITILVSLVEIGILNGIFRYGFPILISALIIALLLGFPVGIGQWIYLKHRSLKIHPIWMGYQFISLYLAILIFYLLERASSYVTASSLNVLFIILGIILIAAALLLLPALAFAWLKFSTRTR